MPKRILIVDDEDDIREVAQMTLEMMAGWEVRAAPSGESALSMAAADPPDAILLDVMMPGMDGPATLARLLADPATARVPVVFLTAKAQAAEQRRLAEMGAAGVLAKPFDPARLAEQVSQVLGWPS
ncbi:MAG TPA: response regulator [Longimicrobium sp.]